MKLIQACTSVIKHKACFTLGKDSGVVFQFSYSEQSTFHHVWLEFLACSDHKYQTVSS